jgi:hypothetical protein
VAIHIAGALAMCVAWAAMGTVLRLAIFPPATDRKVWLGFVSWVFTTLPFGVGVYFALVAIQHSFFYFAQARERETQAARLEAQLSEARLSALRMQLNPHFLFNSLNAITVLVRDGNTGDASRMLELLSGVLRQVLQTDRGHETSLSEELDFLQRYLAIEQVRFSDRLRPRIAIDPSIAQAAVPRFLLQPLVAARNRAPRRCGRDRNCRTAGGRATGTDGARRRPGDGDDGGRRRAVEHAPTAGGALRRARIFGGGQRGRRRRDRHGAAALS